MEIGVVVFGFRKKGKKKKNDSDRDEHIHSVLQFRLKYIGTEFILLFYLHCMFINFKIIIKSSKVSIYTERFK